MLVKIMHDGDEQEKASCKEKKRKRTKAVYQQIREQMEFYFSDANLHRDRFLKKQIDESEDGYVDLAIFLRFNKLRTLTTELDEIIKALSKSEELTLNDDKQRVKRIKPLAAPQNADERTIYVEYLPHDVNHEWLKKLFSSCGKIAYISLPRYKTSGDPKGFAFIEFETESSAKKACEELNNPPVGIVQKPGIFPKTSKQLLALQKNVEDKELEVDGENKEGDERSKHKKHRKRHRGTSESSIDGISEHHIVKRRRTVSGDAVLLRTSELPSSKKHTSESDCSKDESSDSPKKRKLENKDAKQTETGSNPDGTASVTDKGKQDEEDMLSPRKKKKRKRSRNKSELSASIDTEIDNAKKSETESDKNKDNRKRKFDDGQQNPESSTVVEEIETKKTECVSIGEGKKRKAEEEDNADACVKPAKIARESTPPRETDVAKDSKSTKGSAKKKKNRNRKRRHTEKETPEVRVISKKEWLELRSEYLTLQKASMADLKKRLACKKQEKAKAAEATKRNSALEYVPGVIVEVKSENPLTRKVLKGSLSEVADIAYVDLQDGNTSGYLRCRDADSAKKIVSTFKACSCTLLEGKEEKMYWDKLKLDREAKLSQPRTRTKKRGMVKLIEKAQKANAAQMQKKHIVFED